MTLPISARDPTSRAAALPVLLSLHEANFKVMLSDIRTLLSAWESQRKPGKGRPPEALEVFVRSGVILLITAWEAFIEDALRQAFDLEIARAAAPADVRKAFNAVAERWLQDAPKAPDVSSWAGEGWKALISASFARELDKLNTPNSKNLASISTRYLGFDITSSWSWKGTPSEAAAARLDDAIKRRGDLVHQGKQISEQGRGAQKSELDAMMALVERLVSCSSSALVKRYEQR